MKLFVEFLLLVLLVQAFRKVREWRIQKTIVEVAQKKAALEETRRTNIAAASWMKANTRDVQERARRHIHDAPSYTSYTEETGRYRKLSQ